MFNRLAIAAAALCALAAPALAAPHPELDALRAEFEQKFQALQADYEARLKALEGRVQAAESQAGEAQAVAQTAAASAEQTAQATAPASATGAFNPDISLILQGAYIDRAGGERPISGFVPAGEHAHAERGFTLEHTELVMSANIDPYLHGYVNLAVLDEEVEVEEAWFQSLHLGHGLTVKGGRFLSGIGYQNARHPHTWDFADNNLVYEALFGEHLIQDGLQLRWLAPTALFLEFGAEVARGQFFPGSDEGADKNGAGSWAVFGHLGGDVGASHSWRAGLSYLKARPREREGWVEDLNDVEALTLFSGDSKTWLADFVWKWAPNGNPRQRNFTFTAEYFQRDEDGDLACADNTADGGACLDLTDAYGSDQSGWYAQAVYQFMPRWRVGTRYSRLSSGSTDFGLNAASLDGGRYHPRRWSLMADFSPSEFSRFRLQYNRDETLVGAPDDQFIVQYIMSLGPHGAHQF
ncbi:TonB-dependent receptor [Immundisolibacter sp.]|uniref:TonB-dependent receptor n=1 Tax=Immundisolibacter sp. TaxID=1934948 RepID=UPI003F874D99